MHNPWWHPESLSRRRPFLEARARVLAQTRCFFEQHCFVEVDTPILQRSPGADTHITACATVLEAADPSRSALLYLHTSPEFGMKKLLAGGMQRIYQLGKVFRNRERSPIHHPEFTMLEWYRTQTEWYQLMDDCIELVRQCSQANGNHLLAWNGCSCDPFKPWKQITVAEAFQLWAGVDLMATISSPCYPQRDELADQAVRAGVRVHDGDTWEDIFFRIMLELIEPNLGIKVPCFLTDYPAPLAGLTRSKADNHLLCERFELYICTMEVANASGELIHPQLCRDRIEANMELRQQLYHSRYPLDQELIDAFESGMPAASGIALGFDRLVMVCSGAREIEDVLWSPVAEA